MMFKTIEMLLISGLTLSIVFTFPIAGLSSPQQKSTPRLKSVEDEFEKIYQSSHGRTWELQHYNPKVRQPISKVNEYLQKMFLEVPQIQIERKMDKLTNNEKGEIHSIWREWSSKVITILFYMNINPSPGFIPAVKQIIKQPLPLKEVDEFAEIALGQVRLEAIRTLGILGENPQYLRALLESKDNYIFAGAVSAITFQLSMLPDPKPLEEFWSSDIPYSRRLDKILLTRRVGDELKQIVHFKRRLQKAQTVEEKLNVIISELHVIRGENGRLEVTDFFFPCYYSFREFYNLYTPNRAEVIRLLRKKLGKIERFETKAERFQRIGVLEWLYFLGIPLTEKERKEVGTVYKIEAQWSPLTLPGVPIYNPDDYKRK